MTTPEGPCHDLAVVSVVSNPLLANVHRLAFFLMALTLKYILKIAPAEYTMATRAGTAYRHRKGAHDVEKSFSLISFKNGTFGAGIWQPCSEVVTKGREAHANIVPNKIGAPIKYIRSCLRR